MYTDDKGFSSITIAGLGLIGGSLAKSFHRLGIKLYGFDMSTKAINTAADSGIFHGLTDDIELISEFESDLIYACLPVTPCAVFLEDLKKLGIKTPVTDGASTKSSVVKAATGLNYCGGHPIAGKEVSGFENSDGNLFKGAFHILTPTADTDPYLCDKLETLHDAIGMKVARMTPEYHDRVFGSISHLPHITAFSLVEAVHEIDDNAFGFTGGGFRDFTRIAASNPKMWTDIFLDNKDNMLEFIDIYIEKLEEWKKNIIDGESTTIYERIDKARAIRQRLK